MEPAGQFTRQTGRHRPNAVQHQQLPQPPRDERNGRRAGFGNALTTEEDANESNANLKGRPAATIGTATPRIDESEETNEMQVELLERVATMVEYSETKLSSFRHAIRLYKNNEAPARDLVDTVYSVLNRDTEDTYRVVRRIADTMRGDDDKVQGILAALQSFKVDVSFVIEDCRLSVANHADHSLVSCSTATKRVPYIGRFRNARSVSRRGIFWNRLGQGHQREKGYSNDGIG